MADRVLITTDDLEQAVRIRSEEHTSELQSHSFISYAVFCLKKKHGQFQRPGAVVYPGGGDLLGEHEELFRDYAQSYLVVQRAGHLVDHPLALPHAFAR